MFVTVLVEHADCIPVGVDDEHAEGEVVSRVEGEKAAVADSVALTVPVPLFDAVPDTDGIAVPDDKLDDDCEELPDPVGTLDTLAVSVTVAVPEGAWGADAVIDALTVNVGDWFDDVEAENDAVVDGDVIVVGVLDDIPLILADAHCDVDLVTVGEIELVLPADPETDAVTVTVTDWQLDTVPDSDTVAVVNGDAVLVVVTV